MCAVWVDDMYRYPMGKYGRMKMSHMIADTEEELHAMADKIGLSRRHYQGDHYDISLSKRNEAIRNGARAITWRQLGRMAIGRRKSFINRQASDEFAEGGDGGKASPGTPVASPPETPSSGSAKA